MTNPVIARTRVMRSMLASLVKREIRLPVSVLAKKERSADISLAYMSRRNPATIPSPTQAMSTA